MSLDIESIVSNPNARVQIVFNDQAPKKGGSGARRSLITYLTDPFRFSTSSRYTDVNVANSWEPINQAIHHQLAKIAGFNQGNISAINLSGTMAEYQGTSPATLNVPIVFVASAAAGATEDVREYIKPLIKATYPDIAIKSGTKGIAGVMRPPLGYQSGVLRDNGGLMGGGVSLRVGNWFKVPSLLVVTNFDFQLSEVATDKGYPLWIRGSLELQFAVAVDAAKVMSWFSINPVKRAIG